MDEQVPEEGDLDVEVGDHLKILFEVSIRWLVLMKTANTLVHVKSRLFLLFTFQYDTQTYLSFEPIICTPDQVFKVHHSVVRDNVMKLV